MAEAPAPMTTNPFAVLWRDIRTDRAAKVPWPPGETNFSLPRTRHFDRDPLGLLLAAYERYGPIFTLRIFHHNAVFMLGPAANHYILVSHAKNFLWREGHLRDLIPLLGDGLLTIDGVPPHAPQADAPRLPPRADRGRDRHDARGGRSGAR